jgi:tetratricopeptide (TPR) repeat protein
VADWGHIVVAENLMAKVFDPETRNYDCLYRLSRKVHRMTNRISAAWSPIASGIFAAVGLAIFGTTLVPSAAAWSAENLAKRASWRALSPAEVIDRVRGSLDQIGLSDEKIDGASEDLLGRLSEADGDVLGAVIGSMSEVLPAIERMKSLATQSPTVAATWFASADPLAATFDQLPPVIAATARTWLARELVQKRLYDEALPVFENVEPTDCLDPAAVLFYRGVCRHSLLMKKEALADLRRLLENEADSPVRFVRTAQLMVADIKPLKEDSLDEISRMMTDVTRRLDLGRANSEVQEREQKIIDKLTKLIEDIEEKQRQQQQQQQQAAGGQGSGQERPMEDSQIAGGSGQGDVDRKNIGQRDGWGNLPPAEREEALQQISRDLPTHYREAIEAYFRKLATGS